MYLSDRKTKIISELLHNDSCITGQYLANVAGVTSRTIRADVSELNKELNDDEIEILSITGKGYFIPKESKKKARELINIEQNYRVPILPESRIEHIIKKLLIQPKGVSKQDIADELFVSKSTLDRDFSKIEQIFIDRQIELERISEDVFCISGDECELREMYNDILADAIKRNFFSEKEFGENIKEKLERTKEKVYKAIKINNIFLSEDVFSAVSIFLTIVFFRVSEGYIIDKFDGQNASKNKFIEDIIKLMKDEIIIHQGETEYIRQHLDDMLFGKSYGEKKSEIEAEVKKAVKEVEFTFDYVFSGGMTKRLYDTISKNSEINSGEHSLDDIKREYPMAFEMSVSLVNYLESEMDILIRDNVLTDIVLLFAAEMEREALKEEEKKRSIIVVCQSGDMSREFLEIKIKRFFPNFNIIGFFAPYDIESGKEKNPDIILSTVMIESNNTPMVLINPLLKDYDILKINSVIRQIEHSESIGYEFINIFKETLFVKDMEAFDKYDAIKKLYDRMLQCGYASDGYFQSVLDREKISATALGNMVAVPHAINANIGENIAAIGILKKPVEWNGEKVQLVFLINIGNTKDNNVKQIFRSFFDVISASGKVDRLIKARNYYEFIKRINQ